MQETLCRPPRLGLSMPPWLRSHGEQVGKVAFSLARAAGLGDTEAQTAWVAGYLHDIGKLVMPFRFWTAPRQLTATERLAMQAHPAVGVVYLEEQGVTDQALLVAILEHHERMDGSGYPRNLPGSRISPLGRLLAVADAYVAMSEARPYRPARPNVEVLAALRAGVAGGPLDPFWLDILDKAIRQGYLAVEGGCVNAAVL